MTSHPWVTFGGTREWSRKKSFIVATIKRSALKYMKQQQQKEHDLEQLQTSWRE